MYRERERRTHNRTHRVMENQSKESAATESEEFPDEFQCCVCLDLFYKPIVLACGHISCFWCVYKAMNTWHESRCPVCRQPYNHFPSICHLLHVLLLKLYPLAYKRREIQVSEEEKETGHSSPRLNDHLSAPHPSKECNNAEEFSPHSYTSQNKVHVELSSSGVGEPSLIKDSSEIIVPVKDCTITVHTMSSCEATGNMTAQEKSVHGNKLVHGTCDQVLITDLLCVICKQLLYRPTVLNCGHAYCETCIINIDGEVCRCQICPSVHPYGFPKVCLVLEHILEEQFSEEYAARKEAVLKQADCQYGSPTTCSTQAQQHAVRTSSMPTNIYSSWWSGQGPKVHIGIGCDFCGMCPIIGERYKCKDCVEKIGFDLCEGCYNASSKLTGRFNQQHTSEHKFEIVQPPVMHNLILRLEGEQSEEDVSDDPDDVEDVSSDPVLSGDDALRDPEDSSAALIFTDTSQDQEGTNSTS
ncbi:E3 ubiquitin-protein ligase PRT1-like [Cornus florida]|uniref:E3 ubiquitin-protein ligase PRT1-like n=1 Tax=Cornus florida TaxID=4283 RepID=UPI002897B29B|nr:E3 ubiquitin-protein ligase PRT1-like [Cornus florida]